MSGSNATSLDVLFQQALDLKETDKNKAIDQLHAIVKRDVDSNNEEAVKTKEQAILQLGELFKETSQAKEMVGLITFTRPFLNQLSKVKAAKLVKSQVSTFLDMGSLTGEEIKVCQECISWAQKENRVFLRQALENKLIVLYFECGNYKEGIALAGTLLAELKKMDDKLMLVEVQLFESKIYHALGNLAKARASLTTAKTTANSIYCPPVLQAGIDLQSGILHAADEKDFKTAFSYFYEAFEGYESVDSPKTIIALKYMLLTKIMQTESEDIQSIVSGKIALRYGGRSLEAMKSIAKASSDRSLAEFEKTKTEYYKELVEDPFIASHLDALYDQLLEQNLCRIIEPYSTVQITYVATQINLNKAIVEKKLSQMILDHKFHGILDQGRGVLIIHDEPKVDVTCDSVIETVGHLGKVVELLFNRAKILA